jgi:hypothetical protein
MMTCGLDEVRGLGEMPVERILNPRVPRVAREATDTIFIT